MMRALLLAITLGLAAPALAQSSKGPDADAPSGEVWKVDQIRVSGDVPETKIRMLESDHSMAAVIARLKGLGIAYQRDQMQVVADKLPAEVRTQWLALPPGEPFIIRLDDAWSISVIVGRALPPGSVRFLPSPRFAQPRKA